MSYNFRWFAMPGKRKLAKMNIATGLDYLVNFIEIAPDQYECFFYPSATSQTQMGLIGKSSVDDLSMQERIYQTLRNVLQEFADKYSPTSITFTTQFQTQLSRITSATIKGYTPSISSGKQIVLNKIK